MGFEFALPTLYYFTGMCISRSGFVIHQVLISSCVSFERAKGFWGACVWVGSEKSASVFFFGLAGAQSQSPVFVRAVRARSKHKPSWGCVWECRPIAVRSPTPYRPRSFWLSCCVLGKRMLREDFGRMQCNVATTMFLRLWITY